MTSSNRGSEDVRPTGDQMLARIGAPATGERPADSRGRLRVYLGMAPGVGKTFRMLEEGHRRLERGTDVVVGFVETHGRPHTAELLTGLEQIGRRRIVYRGVTVEEMDTDAVIARHPQVAIIDELAHTNVPGSPHEKRWQDIEQIRDAGIDVISTCNVQHLESVADAVATITGAPVNERLPDAVLDTADEIELVDMSPHALRQRMKHGNVYPPDRTAIALDRFFTEANLTALRELSLRFVGGQVDAELEDVYTSQGVKPAAQIVERVAVLVSADPSARRAIRRAASLAAALRAPLMAISVTTPATARLSYDRTRDLRENLDYAVDLGAQSVQVEAKSTVDGLSEVITGRRITQLVVAHARRGAVDRLLHPSLATTLFEKVPEVELHLVGEGPETPTFTRPAR